MSLANRLNSHIIGQNGHNSDTNQSQKEVVTNKNNHTTIVGEDECKVDIIHIRKIIRPPSTPIPAQYRAKVL